jgi:esterase/lipase
MKPIAILALLGIFTVSAPLRVHAQSSHGYGVADYEHDSRVNFKKQQKAAKKAAKKQFKKVKKAQKKQAKAYKKSMKEQKKHELFKQ